MSNRELSMIRANDPRRDDYLRFVSGAGSAEILAAEAPAAGQPAKLPALKMRVYNGGVIMQNICFASGRFYSGPVVADLAGMQLPSGPSPVLCDHDLAAIVGHGQATIVAGLLSVEGVVSGTGAAAQEFLANSRNGFPYQASMGARILVAEDVEAGATVEVNGQTFEGPLLIARQSEFKEASVVPLGADPDTVARVAASQKEHAMDPKLVAWLKAKGHNDPKALSEAQLASLKAEYDATLVPAPTPVTPSADAATIQAARVEGARLERERAGAIRAEAQGLDVASDVVEASVTAGDTIDAARGKFLSAIRARSTSVGAPAIGSGQPETNAMVLEAALCISNRAKVGLDDARLVATYGERTVEAARRFGRMYLSEIMAECARLEGKRLPVGGRGSNAWIKAAISTLSLPGILSNVANKALLSAYQAVPSAARQVAKIGQVSDFKVHTRYRLTGNMTFEKVRAGGELAHGTLGEQSFTQQADTYGKFFALDRQSIINDDLGAFLDIPQMMGRGAALAIEEAFFTLLLSNPSSFFSASPTGYNANYGSGAGSALSASALNLALARFLAQVDPDGKPINVVPEILLVPPGLKATADQLFASLNLTSLATGLSSTAARVVEQLGDANIHAGKYRPVMSPYLANASFSGYSATAWYLFANPANLAAAEIAFLNGQEQPVVENADLPSDVLGLGFRGYNDFGVAMLDPRAADKSAGV